MKFLHYICDILFLPITSISGKMLAKNILWLFSMFVLDYAVIYAYGEFIRDHERKRELAHRELMISVNEQIEEAVKTIVKNNDRMTYKWKHYPEYSECIIMISDEEIQDKITESFTIRIGPDISFNRFKVNNDTKYISEQLLTALYKQNAFSIGRPVFNLV